MIVRADFTTNTRAAFETEERQLLMQTAFQSLDDAADQIDDSRKKGDPRNFRRAVRRLESANKLKECTNETLETMTEEVNQMLVAHEWHAAEHFEGENWIMQREAKEMKEAWVGRLPEMKTWIERGLFTLEQAVEVTFYAGEEREVLKPDGSRYGSWEEVEQMWRDEEEAEIAAERAETARYRREAEDRVESEMRERARRLMWEGTVPRQTQ